MEDKMASRSEMNKKPQAENLQPKLRRCLMCADEFQSHHIGERVCPDCKSTSTWRQTGIAI
jgi:Zn finger protein HypA/HybF involved in hydrogenase expression